MCIIQISIIFSDQNHSELRRWVMITSLNKRKNNPTKKHHHPQYHPVNIGRYPCLLVQMSLLTCADVLAYLGRCPRILFIFYGLKAEGMYNKGPFMNAVIILGFFHSFLKAAQPMDFILNHITISHEGVSFSQNVYFNVFSSQPQLQQKDWISELKYLNKFNHRGQ